MSRRTMLKSAAARAVKGLPERTANSLAAVHSLQVAAEAGRSPYGAAVGSFRDLALLRGGCMQELPQTMLINSEL